MAPGLQILRPDQWETGLAYYTTQSILPSASIAGANTSRSKSASGGGTGFESRLKQALYGGGGTSTGASGALRSISSGSPLVYGWQVPSVSRKSTLGNLSAAQAYARQAYGAAMSEAQAAAEAAARAEAAAAAKAAKAAESQNASDASKVRLPASKTAWTGEEFSAPGIYTEEAEQVGGNIYQFHNAHFVEKDGTIYAYFIDHSDGSLNDVGLATSKDGVNFTYQGKVLTKGEDGFDANKASFPCVQYDGETGQWYMLYEATSATGDVDTVSLATSTDGYNWEKQGPVISPGDAGWISGVDVGTPTMFKEDGTWHVYFHTFAEDARVRIGYASGPSLDQLTVKNGPLLDVDASGNETVTVGARSRVFKSGDYYYMAYEVSAGDNYDFGTHQWGVNLARAESPGGPWEKKDGTLLVSSAQPGWGPDGPEILQTDEGTYLYYRTEGNTTERTRLVGV